MVLTVENSEYPKSWFAYFTMTKLQSNIFNNWERFHANGSAVINFDLSIPDLNSKTVDISFTSINIIFSIFYHLKCMKITSHYGRYFLIRFPDTKCLIKIITIKMQFLLSILRSPKIVTFVSKFPNNEKKFL